MRKIFPFILLVAIEIYVFQGIKAITEDYGKLARGIWRIGYATQAIFCLVVIGLMLLKGKTIFDVPGFKGLFLIAFILFVGKLFFLLFLIIDDLIRLFRHVFSYFGSSDITGTDISRLKFLSQIGVVAAALPIAGLTFGIIKGAHHYKIREVTLKLKNLPNSFVGKRLVQLSDIHAGSFWDKEAVRGGINKLIDLKPDMVFITGDLVNDRADELNEYQDLFTQIKAPLGVYSVLGNHDYGDYVEWESEEAKVNNLEELKKRQKEMGWDLLMNEHREIRIGEDKIVVAGIENFGAKAKFPKYGKMSEAMKNVNPEDTILLLSHDPSHWRYEVLKKYKMVDATFSGHTHGAQFGIETAGFKWSPVKYIYNEWAGLYKDNENQLYVNRGFGYLGYPGRMGIRPEITLVTLEKA